MSVGVVVVTISEAIALPLLVLLWRRRGPLVSKAAWSLLLLVPLIGPLAFGALYSRPPRRREGAVDYDLGVGGSDDHAQDGHDHGDAGADGSGDGDGD